MSVWSLLCIVIVVMLVLISLCVFPVWEADIVEICIWGQPSNPASVWGMCDGLRTEAGDLVFPGTERSIEINVASDSSNYFFDLSLWGVTLVSEEKR